MIYEFTVCNNTFSVSYPEDFFQLQISSWVVCYGPQCLMLLPGWLSGNITGVTRCLYWRHEHWFLGHATGFNLESHVIARARRYFTRIIVRAIVCKLARRSSLSWVCQILNFENRTIIKGDTAIFVNASNRQQVGIFFNQWLLHIRTLVQDQLDWETILLLWSFLLLPFGPGRS